ncbi:FMN reductase [Tamaricihabitans halophyticus]|uniref:FMN reductase n=1 Tax=Tamaricihabitans halophyticus TaxID=1262583 RepID=A0A4R2QN31_9PSEU|nr:FMN reductase [Tamaricihabitans halophyticus]TCP49998.1 FMN reductase [Tamaricihabitans halophyticus]
MTERRIAVVSAGLGRPSSTRLLADRLSAATTAELAARELSSSVETFELRDIAHDIVNAMLTGFPAGQLRETLAEITGADGLIAVSPLFTTSYSGLFKSFVDILEQDSLNGVPVLLGATGGTPRHSLALEYAMRPLFTYLHADVVPTSVFAATDDWSGNGDQVNPLPKRIQRAGGEFADRITQRVGAHPTDPFQDVPSFEQMLRDT